MYVARPLSEYKRNPNALSLPPDGPNSGYLVIQDEESETYSCFGLCKNHTLKDLPFPQNKALTIRFVQSSGQSNPVSPDEDILTSVLGLLLSLCNRQSTSVSQDEVMLIPVLNLPLSANRYYAIKPRGNHKGEAITCSREEDKTTCCFCRCVKDIKPKPFDTKNNYQQFEIHAYEGLCVGKGYYYAKSVASDGYPPYYMRRKGWSIYTKTPKNYQLEEAPGLNASLRARLPGINFPPSYRTSEALVVGKWYTPFVFVKEGTLRGQMETSVFYQVTLEQKWEQIFSRHNDFQEGRSVSFAVSLDLETASVGGNKATWDERNAVEGAIWFRSHSRAGEEATVGLSVELVQRMKWEEERGGWGGGKERQVRVERSDKFEGHGHWKEFGCYVLVESFVIKRLDGSVVMTYDFRHTQHIKTIWN